MTDNLPLAENRIFTSRVDAWVACRSGGAIEFKLDEVEHQRPRARWLVVLLRHGEGGASCVILTEELDEGRRYVKDKQRVSVYTKTLISP
jgi:hypothetical protein